MEILAACDLTQSYRGAALVCGVSHNTVRSYVKAREEGAQAPIARQRGRNTDPYLPQMESLLLTACTSLTALQTGRLTHFSIHSPGKTAAKGALRGMPRQSGEPERNHPRNNDVC